MTEYQPKYDRNKVIAYLAQTQPSAIKTVLLGDGRELTEGIADEIADKIVFDSYLDGIKPAITAARQLGKKLNEEDLRSLEIRLEMKKIILGERVRAVTTLSYEGKEIGKIVEIATRYKLESPPEISPETKTEIRREFETELSASEAMDLAYELSIEDRIHMRKNAYPIFRLVQFHESNPEDYLSNEEIVIFAAELGCKNLTELFRKDHRTWELVKQRELERKLFPELKPADLSTNELEATEISIDEIED